MYTMLKSCVSFKRTSCRRKDLFEIEESLGLYQPVVLLHIQNCCFSVLPALQHVVAIKSAQEDATGGIS